MINQFQGFIAVFLNRNITRCLTESSMFNDFKKAHKRGSSNSEKKNAKLANLAADQLTSFRISKK